MTSPRMSDLITEEIEAVMTERAERLGEAHHGPGWLIGAFQVALSDRSILREATLRAIRRHDEENRPPVPDQAALWDEAT